MSSPVGPEKLAAYPTEWSLFISWPPYDQSFGTECLARMQQRLCDRYRRGLGRLHRRLLGSNRVLKAGFRQVESQDIPQWDGIHDYLVVHRRILPKEHLLEVVNERWRSGPTPNYEREDWEPFDFPKEPLERNSDHEERNLAGRSARAIDP